MTIALPTDSGFVHVLDRAVVGRLPWLVLVTMCLVLWLPGFFTLPPGDRDESRFAQATKQMTETGDYVQIRNGTVARNQKPIGIYWLQLPFVAAARMVGLGRSNPIWPYRIPSLLGGVLAVLATYGFGRRLVGRPAALLAAMFLAGSVVLTFEVHIAKTDAALLAATTLAMGTLSRAWLDPGGLPRRSAWAFWAALGLAILIKGPIAPMVCGLSVLWLAVTDRKRGAPRWLLALRPKSGIWLLLAIVLPWCIAIGFETHGRFFAQSVGGDLAGKLAGSDDAHGAFAGLHLLLLPALLFAGGGAALCAIPSTWRVRKMPEIRFLIAWIAPSWLVFELAATKLPHYTLPLYPAVALLAARWMLTSEKPGVLARSACGVAIVVVMLLGLVAAALPFIVQSGIHESDLLGLPVLAITTLLAWLIWCAWPNAQKAAVLMLCATPLIYFSLLGVELPSLAPLWIAPQVEAALRVHWQQGKPAKAMVGELGFAEPSLIFLVGTDTQLLADPLEAAQFLASGDDHVLVVNDQNLSALKSSLQARGQAITRIASVSGFDYSRGRRVRLTLLADVAAQSIK